MLHFNIQGGAVTRGLKQFFSLYRSSYLIGLKSTGWCWLDPFNFNFIFLSDGITAATERAACFADLSRR